MNTITTNAREVKQTALFGEVVARRIRVSLDESIRDAEVLEVSYDELDSDGGVYDSQLLESFDIRGTARLSAYEAVAEYAIRAGERYNVPVIDCINDHQVLWTPAEDALPEVDDALEPAAEDAIYSAWADGFMHDVPSFGYDDTPTTNDVETYSQAG
jgi:hypothetical protein